MYVPSSSKNIFQILIQCSRQKLKKTDINFYCLFSTLFIRTLESQGDIQVASTVSLTKQQMLKKFKIISKDTNCNRINQWSWIISEESFIQPFYVTNVKLPVILSTGSWHFLFPFLLFLILLSVFIMWGIIQDWQINMRYAWKI